MQTKDSLLLKRKNHLGREIRQNALPQNFCAAPFSQMFIYPTGDVYVCCEGAGHLGNLKEKNLDELWNGEAVQNLRKEFLDGKPLQCANKINCKSCHLNYDEQIPDIELLTIQKKPPQYLDLVLNGKCNIDCIMCEVKTKTESLISLKGFQTEIVDKVLPTVKEISLKSGEPFVQKETYELINIVKNINDKCHWKFTTNGQYILNDKIKNIINEIKITRITFSIDSIDENIFRLIRKKGELSKALNTIKKFQDYDIEKIQPMKMDFAVNITVQKDNWHNCIETYEYFVEKEIQPYFLIVQEPKEFSLETATVENKIKILNHLLEQSLKKPQAAAALYQAIKIIFKNNAEKELVKIKFLLELQLIENNKKVRNRCLLPSTQVSIYPDGHLRPCCWLGDVSVAEKKKEIDFKKVWQSPVLKQLQNSFNNNVSPSICIKSIETTACHKQNHNRSHFLKPSGAPPEQMPALHWYFSGKCNLSCPMCNNWKHHKDFDEAEDYLLDLRKSVFPFLCEFEVVGGEPFYQKRTFELINELAVENPYLSWIFTTNGQLDFTNQIKSSLEKIFVTHLSVSIDSLNENVFSKIRRGGSLSKALTFLEAADEYRKENQINKKFRLSLNFVLQKENVNELRDIGIFAQKKNIELYVIFLTSPFESSLASSDLSIIEKAYFEVTDLNYAKSNISDIKNALHRLMFRSKILQSSPLKKPLNKDHF